MGRTHHEITARGEMVTYVYQEMVKQLQELGVGVNAEEEKAAISPSGGSPSEWNLYYPIHNILGTFKMNNIEKVMEENIIAGPSQESTSYLSIELFEDVEFLNEDASTISDPSTEFAVAQSETELLSYPREVPARKKKDSFQIEILKKIAGVEEEIKKQTAELRDTNKKNYELENRRTAVLEEFYYQRTNSASG